MWLAIYNHEYILLSFHWDFGSYVTHDKIFGANLGFLLEYQKHQWHNIKTTISKTMESFGLFTNSFAMQVLCDSFAICLD